MAGDLVPGAARRIWQRRTPVDSRTALLHALLDKALAAGASPVAVESDLADLLNVARRRGYRDDLKAGREWRPGQQD